MEIKTIQQTVKITEEQKKKIEKSKEVKKDLLDNKTQVNK